jgi:N-acetyl-anhydromuramyl-L-alanine amidase AmpD
MSQRSPNEITIIVIHCSDSDLPEHDNIDIIREWHKKKGWMDVGYHYYIQQSGHLQLGRSIDKVCAHTKGFNSESIGICLGGKTVFTEAQFKRAAKLIDNLFVALPSIRKENGIVPHRLLDPGKTCPNFNLQNIVKHMSTKIQIDFSGKK